jgi:glyoxylase-like metal-dependent hydrolase (beta-lactamase superfamily II)
MEARVLRYGEPTGSGMVVRWQASKGFEFFAIGVSNSFLDELLGPTWAYVLPLDKITLLDTGMPRTLDSLENGLHVLGLSLSDIERVIVSHGHADHDGNVPELAQKVSPEVWAHEVYSSLMPLDGHEMEHHRFGHLYDGAKPPAEFVDRMKWYKDGRQGLSGIRGIRDGDLLGPLTLMHTPGHSPDEMCIVGPSVVFSGDHVLPQITPHPTTAVVHNDFGPYLPEEYRGENRSYGLKIYLQSLRRILEVDSDGPLMPAHRLFFNGEFHLERLVRAQDIIDHHVERSYEIIEQTRRQSKGLQELTKSLFEKEQGVLSGRPLQMAITETIAHLELLKEAGDVMYEDHTYDNVECAGTERFKEIIRQLKPVPLPLIPATS